MNTSEKRVSLSAAVGFLGFGALWGILNFSRLGADFSFWSYITNCLGFGLVFSAMIVLPVSLYVFSYNSKENKAKRAQDRQDALQKEEDAIQVKQDRQDSIQQGNFDPIDVPLNLAPGEEAYAQFSETRYYADREKTLTTTTVTQTKKSGLGRAIVGGAIAGPVGAVVGASTKKGKSSSETNTKEYVDNELIDRGTLYFTNKRFLYVGETAISIPHESAISVEIKKRDDFPYLTKVLVVWDGMEKGANFCVPTESTPNLYYQGVKKKIETEGTTHE